VVVLATVLNKHLNTRQPPRENGGCRFLQAKSRRIAIKVEWRSLIVIQAEVLHD
jgi:hypothetical protein